MQNGRGFTIVELLIVIVVIAILATITIIGYNGIQSRSVASVIKSDLSNAAKLLELAKIHAGTSSYPTTLPADLKVSNNIGLSLSEADDGYCINGQTLTGAIQYFHASSAGLRDGTCPGAVIEQSERGMPSNQVIDTGFSSLTPNNASSWYVARNGSAGPIIATTRSGATGDPFPNRQVLRIANTANSAVNWVYLSGPVRYQGITAGKNYTVRYWVRLASGTYTGAPHYIGVQNASATDFALNSKTGTGAITSTWREVSRTVTASNNGTAAHLIYIALDTPQLQTNSFALEYQGFEIYEN